MHLHLLPSQRATSPYKNMALLPIPQNVKFNLFFVRKKLPFVVRIELAATQSTRRCNLSYGFWYPRKKHDLGSPCLLSPSHVPPSSILTRSTVPTGSLQTVHELIPESPYTHALTVDVSNCSKIARYWNNSCNVMAYLKCGAWTFPSSPPLPRWILIYQSPVYPRISTSTVLSSST